MKTTTENIQNSRNGYIGTIVDKRYGQPNLLNNCHKNDNEISVTDNESQAPTVFTVSEFVEAYKNRTLQIL